MTLKERFIQAVEAGQIGSLDDNGIIITFNEFKEYFKDIKTGYISSFLPAATIEAGRYSMSHTKYLFRIKKGVYRVHPDLTNIQH